MGSDVAPVLSEDPAQLLTDTSPRPPHCYDPTTPPYRDDLGVHVYDHPTIRGAGEDYRQMRAPHSANCGRSPGNGAHPAEPL